jgi:hypothetical protein
VTPIRIAVFGGVRRFMHGGIEVSENWRSVTLCNADGTPDEKQRAALRDYHGRFIQVHPSDRPALAKHGLVFVDPHSPLRDLRSPPAPEPEPAPKNPKNPKPDAGGKTDAKKADTVGAK